MSLWGLFEEDYYQNIPKKDSLNVLLNLVSRGTFEDRPILTSLHSSGVWVNRFNSDKEQFNIAPWMINHGGKSLVKRAITHSMGIMGHYGIMHVIQWVCPIWLHSRAITSKMLQRTVHTFPMIREVTVNIHCGNFVMQRFLTSWYLS